MTAWPQCACMAYLDTDALHRRQQQLVHSHCHVGSNEMQVAYKLLVRCDDRGCVRYDEAGSGEP